MFLEASKKIYATNNGRDSLPKFSGILAKCHEIFPKSPIWSPIQAARPGQVSRALWKDREVTMIVKKLTMATVNVKVAFHK